MDLIRAFIALGIGIVLSGRAFITEHFIKNQQIYSLDKPIRVSIKKFIHSKWLMSYNIFKRARYMLHELFTYFKV